MQAGNGTHDKLLLISATFRSAVSLLELLALIGGFPPFFFFRWLPIMQAYEAGKPAYFATPPVNLIYALHVALSAITKGKPSIDERFAAHREQSARVRAAAAALGLKIIAKRDTIAANGMTAVRCRSVERKTQD